MFEWDQDKSDQNMIDRGFGFDRALDFDFDTAKIVEDTRNDYGEPRYRIFGRIEGIPYALVITPRGKDTRIISMRRMHEKEAGRYGI